jgi:hypothetical protein
MEGQKDPTDRNGKKVLSSQDGCNLAEASWMYHGSGGREHVSFRTNMST